MSACRIKEGAEFLSFYAQNPLLLLSFVVFEIRKAKNHLPYFKTIDARMKASKE